MNRFSVTVGIYMLAVFLSGVVVGGFGHRLYTAKSVSATAPSRPDPEEYRRRYITELKARLDLNDEQLRQVNGILDQTRERFKQLREKHRPEMKAIHDGQVSQINSILTEPQRVEYEKFRAEREKQRNRDRKPL